MLLGLLRWNSTKVNEAHSSQNNYCTSGVQENFKQWRQPQGTQFTAAPPQHRLYFFPEPHGHGSFRPTLEALRRGMSVQVMATRASLARMKT